MIPKSRMTLDMYRWQAGLKTEPPVRPEPLNPREGAADNRFDKVLDSAAAKKEPLPGKAAQGATLADYQRRQQTDAAATFFRNSTRFNGRLARLASHPFDRISHPAKPKPATTAKLSEDAVTQPPDPTAGDAARTSIQISIEAAARKYNLPSKLIRSVIHAESNFRSDAVSPAGAQGLMQLMPATAREMGVTDPFDVRQNIDGGTKYLRQMLDRFGGDLKLALAAYNAGPGTVTRYNGDVPYRETRDYVRRVLAGMDAVGHPSA